MATLRVTLAIAFALLGATALQAEPPATSETLAQQIAQLSPAIRNKEATLLAAEAHARARQLAREYRAVRSPHFHNFLVNAGLKKRGLCHHWTRDLGDHLAALKLRSVVLRWGIAHAGTLREHSAVVVTAAGQPFERGIVLDAWRHSGRLFSGRVAADKYPWKEDPHETFAPRRLTRL